MAGEGFQKKITMGLGDAMSRLAALDRDYHRGVLGTHALRERNLLSDALNQYPVHVLMDCVTDEDQNGIPDDIEIFAKSAQDDCCRADLLRADGSKPSARPKEAGVPKLIRSSSRGSLDD